MSLIYVVLILAVVGLVLYLIENYIPMAEPIKLVIRILVVIVIVLWLLQIFGVVGPTVPNLRQ